MRYSKGIKALCDQILISYHLFDLVFPKNAIIVDVGANVGEVSYALLRKHSTIEVISIEPDPKDFKDLEKNLKSFSSIVLNSAISDFEGSIPMFLNNDFGDTSFFKTDKSIGKETVSCTTLDAIYKEYLGNKSIFLIKCEAEGLEPEVLTGGAQMLLNTKYVCCDTGPERAGESTFEKANKILTDFNFRFIAGNSIRNLYLNNLYKSLEGSDYVDGSSGKVGLRS
jgi:FkbM family methyltransferase